MEHAMVIVSPAAKECTVEHATRAMLQACDNNHTVIDNLLSKVLGFSILC